MCQCSQKKILSKRKSATVQNKQNENVSLKNAQLKNVSKSKYVFMEKLPMCGQSLIGTTTRSDPIKKNAALLGLLSLKKDGRHTIDRMAR